MKKVLSILGTISLLTIISTNVIACKKPNENNKPNKLNEPIEIKFIPQQPPENSDGKLIKNNNRKNEFIEPNNKGYFYIRIKILSKKNINKNIIKYICEKIFFNSSFIKNKDMHGQHLIYGNKFPIYRWDGNCEPKTPTINKNNGEITDGN